MVQGTFMLLFLILPIILKDSFLPLPSPQLFSLNSDFSFAFIALKLINKYHTFVCLFSVYFLHWIKSSVGAETMITLFKPVYPVSVTVPDTVIFQ